MTSQQKPSRSLSDQCCEAIAELAAQDAPPESTAILAAVRRQIGPLSTQPARVRTQASVAVVASYFRYYAPGPGWRFVGEELSLEPGRTDLMWMDASGGIVMDAVVAGASPSRGELAAVARRLRDRALAVHGERDLLALRVVVPRSPERSFLISRRSFAPA